MNVRVYKRTSGIWWASYTANHGTVRRSTRTHTEEEARAVVESWPLDGPKMFKFAQMGLVYFAEAVGADRVKIGWTRGGGLNQRIADLQVACPFPLVVRTSYPGMMSHERIEQANFDSAWLHGEWFKKTPALAARIDRLARDFRGPPGVHAERTEAHSSKRGGQ